MLAVIKLLHITCAAMSITGFVLRGIIKFTNPEKLAKRWIKITPHVIDTFLLITAIVLVYQKALYPTEHNWIMAKLVGLVIYIVLGMVTLRFSKTNAQAIPAFFAALLCYTYVVSVAVTKSAWPF